MNLALLIQPLRRQPIPLAICSGLLLLFGILSYSAIRTKSPTYDEPLHALGGWIHLYEHDFRINFEDPPLWQYWAVLGSGRNAIKIDKTSNYWTGMTESTNQQWLFAHDTLYETAGNDGFAFIMRFRFMMVLLGILMGALIVAWGWQLGGPIAAIIAATLFALDPNMIAHSALMKNDAPMALMMTAVFFVCWRVGRKLTWANGLGLAFVTAAAINVKFSGLLFGPMFIVLLGMRVLLPQPWLVLGRELKTRLAKSIAAIGLLATISVVSYIGIWACYGFRFNPSPDPAVALNTPDIKQQTVQYQYQATHPQPIPEPLDPSVPLQIQTEKYSEAFDAFIQAMVMFDVALPQAKISPAVRNTLRDERQKMSQVELDGRLLRENAQAFIARAQATPNRDANFNQQFTNVYYNMYVNRGVLMKDTYDLQGLTYLMSVGDEAPDSFTAVWNVLLKWHVLPSAFLHGVLFVHARSLVRGSFLMNMYSATGWWYYFPCAMLFKTPVATLITLLGSAAIGIWLLAQRRKQWRDFAWPVACLLVPFAIYMISVMSANLNIGVRHVLGVYPFMYIAAALVLAWTLRKWRLKAAIPLLALAVLLLIETAFVWPDYIAYFNFAFGGERGGLKLLADSNLDWGQDLLLLAKWQKQNADVPLALAYFDSKVNDPAFFGITSDPLPPGAIDPKLASTHVLAISATRLQGVYGDHYEAYRGLPPLTVLGGTIYLYDLRKK